jgi:hypothetical protein
VTIETCPRKRGHATRPPEADAATGFGQMNITTLKGNAVN